MKKGVSELCNRSSDTPFVVLRPMVLSLLSTEEQHNELRCEDTQEHTQRINRRIADSRSLARANRVGVSEGWRVGVCTGKHTHYCKVVELVLHACYSADNQDRDDCDDETSQYVQQTIAFYNRVPEVGTSLYTYTRKEQHKTYLSKHHISGCRGVGVELHAVAEAAFLV